MTNYSLIIKPDAELDIQDAYQYYEERKIGLGSEFVRAVDACVSKIGRNPTACPVVHNQIRRGLVRKYPYGIFYIIEDSVIFVIACFHAKRNPRDWDARS